MDTTYPKVQGSCNTPQSVTVDLEALQNLFINSSDDGMTVEEIADTMGISPHRVRKLVKCGVKAGKVQVGRRYVENDWDGRNRQYIVYKMA